MVLFHATARELSYGTLQSRNTSMSERQGALPWTHKVSVAYIDQTKETKLQHPHTQDYIVNRLPDTLFFSSSCSLKTMLN